MPSDTLLNLTNKVALTTGDFSPLVTVVGSPGNIAERVMHFLNITLKDVVRKMDFPVLHSSFVGAGDGVTTSFATSIVDVRATSNLSVAVGNVMLTEVSRDKLHSLSTTNSEQGASKYFSRGAGTTANELILNIYPAPASGAVIDAQTETEPTLFTLLDAATTEIASDDLLLLGTVAHMDAYTGMERGYMQLYEAEKNKYWVQAYSTQQFRVEPEDYR